MPLQCPITLADTYQLKCAHLSGIRLPSVNSLKKPLSQGPELAFLSLSYYGSCSNVEINTFRDDIVLSFPR